MNEPQVQPTPIPLTFHIDTVEGASHQDGTKIAIVRMQIVHAAGVSVFFLEPDDAKRIASQLANEAVKAKAHVGGLIVPRLEIIPNGNGGDGTSPPS